MVYPCGWCSITIAQIRASQAQIALSRCLSKNFGTWVIKPVSQSWMDISLCLSLDLNEQNSELKEFRQFRQHAPKYETHQF
jgi:hypothetical protein